MKQFCEKDGIIARQFLNDIMKELFRKTIHMCSAFMPLLLSLVYWPVLCALVFVLAVYVVAEIMRINGKNIPIISAVTAAAARKRDGNKFVLGPVTLCIGIIASALLWNKVPCAIGIYALAFGDGLASLCGKLFGRVIIPGTRGKTVAGSLTCFTAIFISCFAVSGSANLSLMLASVGMFIEVMPLKDFDNVLIPVVIGGLAQIFIK